MIPRLHRLGVSDFTPVSSWRLLPLRHPYFSVKWRSNSRGLFRCAVVIPTAVSPLAVARNALRRFFYDTAFLALSPFSIDVIFYVKKPAFMKDREALKSAIMALSSSFR